MILKSRLKILNYKELYLRNQLGLIKEIMRASLINFPFQNITSCGAFPIAERKAPGLREILGATAGGHGGLCGHLNNHMKYQLESLGYSVSLVGGCFRRTGVPMSHFMVKVKIPGYAVKDCNKWGVRKDKFYLIDVGCGIPNHEPIPLDNLPFRGRAGGLNFRYERVDENTIQRVNENGDALIGERPSTYLSPQDYEIGLQPRNFTDFTPAVKYIYEETKTAFLHHTVYCFRYLDIKDDDFEIVCVRGKEIIFITRETRSSKLYSSFEELKPSLFKYFPMIPQHEVELTVKHFTEQEEALKAGKK